MDQKHFSGLGCIWLSVAAISLFAPDLVSGSEQQHLPVAAFGTWIWGAVATASFMGSALRLRDGSVLQQLTAAVCVLWLVAAVVGIFAPVMVTGSDPTRLPIAAFIAPVAAAVLTSCVCGVAASFARD